MVLQVYVKGGPTAAEAKLLVATNDPEIARKCLCIIVDALREAESGETDNLPIDTVIEK
jgi:hypothetical protein